MKKINGYVLRKRTRNAEENSARKRMKTKSDSEESNDEDFSPPDPLEDPPDSSNGSDEEESGGSSNGSDEESGGSSNGSDEESGGSSNGSDEESGGSSNGSDEESGGSSNGSDEEESSDPLEESDEEEIEIYPSTFRTSGHGYRSGGESTGKENHFFEPDTEDLSNEITNSVMKTFSGLGLSEKDLKKAIEHSMKQARSDVFDEYCDSKPRDKRWKIGLDKNSVKSLEPELRGLRLDIQNEKPTIPKILASRITRADKKKALDLFNILENTEQYSMERMEIEDIIRNILKIGKGMGEDLERYEKEEVRIKELVGDYNSFLKRQILDLDVTDDVKARIYEMYLDMKSQAPSSSEYSNMKKQDSMGCKYSSQENDASSRYS